jgi:branched-chain amino acid aminotransferase
MAAIANVNGRICTERDATVSVFDHGFLFGEGVYEVVRTYNGHPFLLDRHLRRLRASAGMIALPVPMSDEQITGAIRQTTEAYQAGPGAGLSPPDYYVRMLLTRGVGDGSYNPASSPAPTFVIIVKPLVPPRPDAYTLGVKVSMVSVIRNHPGSVNPLIKSNNLLNNALAMQEALRKGSFEAILRNYRGELSECSQSNLFVVKDGVALTPVLGAGLLAGITRDYLHEVGTEAGVAIEDRVLHEDDLYGADEAFLTSTTREIVPIVRVDDRVIGNGTPGPVTLRLLQAFRSRASQLTVSPAAPPPYR